MPSSSCPHSTPCNKPGLVVFFLAASLVAGCIVWFEHLPYSPYQVRFRLKKDQLEPECSSPEVAAELDGLESDVLATFDHGRITGRRDSLWARGVDWSGTYGRCDLKVRLQEDNSRLRLKHFEDFRNLVFDYSYPSGTRCQLHYVADVIGDSHGRDQWEDDVRDLPSAQALVGCEDSWMVAVFLTTFLGLVGYSVVMAMVWNKLGNKGWGSTGRPPRKSAHHTRSKPSARRAEAAGVCAALSLAWTCLEEDMVLMRRSANCATPVLGTCLFIALSGCFIGRAWTAYRDACKERLEDSDAVAAEACWASSAALGDIPCDHCELTDLLLPYRVVDLCLHPLCVSQFFSNSGFSKSSGSSGLVANSGAHVWGPASVVAVLAISKAHPRRRSLVFFVVIVALPVLLLLALSWVVVGSYMPVAPMTVAHAVRSVIVLYQVGGVAAVGRTKAGAEGTGAAKVPIVL